MINNKHIFFKGDYKKKTIYSSFFTKLFEVHIVRSNNNVKIDIVKNVPQITTVMWFCWPTGTVNVKGSDENWKTKTWK